MRADGLSDAMDAADPEFPDRFRPRSLRRGTPGYRYFRLATRLVVLALLVYWIYAATH